MDLTPVEFTTKLDKVGNILLEHRDSRVPPIRDEKILTGWNGLVITALAQAGMHLNQPQYIDAAIKTAEFLLKTNRQQIEGKDLPRLYRSYFLGSATIDGNQTDYAYLAEGLVALFDATQDKRWLEQAQQLVCLLYTSPSPRDQRGSRMPSSA